MNDAPVLLAGPKVIQRAIEAATVERETMRVHGFDPYTRDEYDLNLTARLYALEQLRKDPSRKTQLHIMAWLDVPREATRVKKRQVA